MDKTEMYINPKCEDIQPSCLSEVGDVNGDGKIGVAEAVHILQKVGGIR
jgi:hypothetical protein